MPIKENIISFDFDGSLDDEFGGGENIHKKETRDFAFRLIRRGYKVYIITRRYGPECSGMGMGMEHEKVWEVARELGIPKERVIFTNRKWKYPFIESVGACMHVDDDIQEKELLEKYLPEVRMIWLGNDGWPQELISRIDWHDHMKIWIGNRSNMLKVGIWLAIILLTIILLA